MNRVRLGSNEDVSYRVEIQEIVEALITQRGYYSAITELLNAIHSLAETLSADPQNYVHQREFSLWVGAVRNAIQKHNDENTFEGRVTDSDRLAARQMGIYID